MLSYGHFQYSSVLRCLHLQRALLLGVRKTNLGRQEQRVTEKE